MDKLKQTILQSSSETSHDIQPGTGLDLSYSSL